MNLFTRRRTWLVYAALLIAWLLILGWQVIEHLRVRAAAKTAVVNRSRDISATLSLVIRSQRRFGGLVSQERLESALTELVKSEELTAVALLNAAGEVVASAGRPIPLEDEGILQTGARWGTHEVALINPVDLGSPDSSDRESSRTIILPRRDSEEHDGSSRSPSERPERKPEESGRTDTHPAEYEPQSQNPPRMDPGFSRRQLDHGDRRRSRRWFGRPPWMDEAEYQSLVERRGLHGLLIAMSTDSFRAALARDLWMRLVVALFATVSAAGLGIAWMNLLKSSDLQMRLLRASELNSHLKEMNIAAAGLAHETRNPLNIVRGLAQMISRQPDASEAVRQKSKDIINETDRVTAQLNEFINYSRPRETCRTQVSLSFIAGEVSRALSYDLEEKNVRFIQRNLDLAVEADEQMLRQVLFNLLMNAIQAAGPGGTVEMVAEPAGPQHVAVEIRDDGPGVDALHQSEIFKPYFTTHHEGTGLGLAVVQRIVLAHGWEIDYLPNRPRGAVFRISHIRQLT